MKKGSSSHLALSFGGSGLMMMYQFGVAKRMAQDGKFMERLRRVHGTSGGAICGAMLVSCPDRFEDAIRFFESGRWLKKATPRDLVEPHQRLLRRAIDELRLETSADLLRHKFVAHATTTRRENVGVDDFQDDREVVDAIAASCCLSPSGVSFRGQTLFDGGFSDPLPSDPDLDTVAVSILSGTHVDLCPDFAARSRSTPLTCNGERGAGGVAPKYRGPPFLRYAVSPRNARALLETTFLTPKRARARYDQGQRDAITFLDAWHNHLNSSTS
eukprot:CAMPEP_0118905952 /NCGR_PEP_ID=MMETSP1166-20130328/9703_1 /TAXON_ID=1104430 /ORGANISM="Chrysoreinhardia sp, Strain CCMP3193" /LENGTH=271 /DNA_ID=CAMNT_0006845223 /DNA_START=85 /DNA_END=900 /DNA_ORIENTATION=-